MTVSMVTGEAVHCRTVESLEEKERAAQMTEHLNVAMHSLNISRKKCMLKVKGCINTLYITNNPETIIRRS